MVAWSYNEQVSITGEQKKGRRAAGLGHRSTDALEKEEDLGQGDEGGRRTMHFMMLLWLKRLYASTSLSALFTDSCPKGQRIFFKAYNEPLESVTRYTYENPLQQSVSVRFDSPGTTSKGEGSNIPQERQQRQRKQESLRKMTVSGRGLFLVDDAKQTTTE